MDPDEVHTARWSIGGGVDDSDIVYHSVGVKLVIFREESHLIDQIGDRHGSIQITAILQWVEVKALCLEIGCIDDVRE